VIPPASELLANLNTVDAPPIWEFGHSVTYQQSPFVNELYRPDVLGTINAAINEHSNSLRELNQNIHGELSQIVIIKS